MISVVFNAKFSAARFSVYSGDFYFYSAIFPGFDSQLFRYKHMLSREMKLESSFESML